MSKKQYKVAIGIGPQTDRTTVNTNAAGWDKLGTAVTSDTAIGIMTEPDSFTMSLGTIKQDRIYRSNTGFSYAPEYETLEPPTISFSVPLKGGGGTVAGTPATANYALTAAMESLFAGAGLGKKASYHLDTAGTSQTYGPGGTLASQAATSTVQTFPEFQTMKIWIMDNAAGHDVAYILGGCFFDLTFNLTGGERATMDVNVHCVDFYQQNTETFPSGGDIDYGTQDNLTDPIIKAADSNINIVASGGSSALNWTRGFVDMTVSVTNPVLRDRDFKSRRLIGSSASYMRTYQTFPSLNRTYQFQGRYYNEWTGNGNSPIVKSADYKRLRTSANGTHLSDLYFTLGTAAGAADTANALKFMLRSADFSEIGYEREGDYLVTSFTATGNTSKNTYSGASGATGGLPFFIQAV